MQLTLQTMNYIVLQLMIFLQFKIANNFQSHQHSSSYDDQIFFQMHCTENCQNIKILDSLSTISFNSNVKYQQHCNYCMGNRAEMWNLKELLYKENELLMQIFKN